MSKLRSGAVASVAAAMLLCASVAWATGSVKYAAGKRSKPPYVFITVSHGKVTSVSWSVSERCSGGAGGAGTNVERGSKGHLKAKISHGHFSTHWSYSISPAPSPLATITGRTTVTGTVSGATAKVTVKDTESDFEDGTCTGSHKFKLHRV